MLTLKEITLVKLVTGFVNNPKIRRKIVCSKEKLWKRFITKKLSVLDLPLTLQEEIMALIKPITVDVDFWRKDHKGIFKANKESCLKFCFNEDGMVDRLKTAELLIHSKRLNVRTRFVLACQYWSRWDILNFFKNLPKATRINILRRYKKGKKLNKHEKKVRIWIKQYKRKLFTESRPWGDRFRLNWNCVSVQSRILDFLSPENKNVYFNAVFERTNKMHVGRFCLSRISADRREQLLTRFPAKVLSIYLFWPYHNYFLNAVNKVWDRLSEIDFIFLLHIIICQRIIALWKDFDYVDLLRQFWEKSPDHLKQFVEGTEIFEVLMEILNHGFHKKDLPRYFYFHAPYFEINADICFDQTNLCIWHQ
ncbi:uncharacterized protein TNCV_3000611 [Trichonephila clavipes]|nr:uncharacterized protein TNCV_3000611 [Trichonephila clavipes]